MPYRDAEDRRRADREAKRRRYARRRAAGLSTRGVPFSQCASRYRPEYKPDQRLRRFITDRELDERAANMNGKPFDSGSI